MNEPVEYIEKVADMGEIRFGTQGDMLMCLGLGSCIGLVLYDKVNKIASLAHIMLPYSAEFNKPIPEKKVIVAENDNNIRNTIKRILENNGYIILGEADKKDTTLELYQKLHPEVSLIGAFLPPTNGIDVIHTLLTLDNNLNAVMLSPEIKKEELVYYLENGVTEIIERPFTETKVLAGIEYTLYRRLLKFADKAIPIMIKKMVTMGADKKNIKAKIAGGAHMFSSITDRDIMDIGKRNVKAVKDILKLSGIKLEGEDTGKDYGRTIRFDVSESILKVYTKEGVREI